MYTNEPFFVSGTYYLLNCLWFIAMSSNKQSTDSDCKSAEALFDELYGEDIVPLSGKGAHRHKTPTKLTPGMIERRKAAQQEQIKHGNILDAGTVIKQVDPFDLLSFVRPGVQHGVFKNLRQGKYEIQSTLDLHRNTVEQARQALWVFLQDCQSHGVRCALVTHGKGENREHPAKLKSCVNHWLQQVDQVLAFHTAQKQHGGSGATYLLLKKSAQARLRTGEQHENRRGE
jgi:DNA-nicking Smr family endonuclease